MTYHQKPTVLIARSGYGSPQPRLAMAGAGDYMLAPGARLYVGPNGQPEESLGGVLDFFKGAGKGVLDFFKQSQQDKGAADALKAKQAAQGGGGLPSWFLPVALVGGGVALVLLLKRPRKNPSRGRRRRRSRRRQR